MKKNAITLETLNNLKSQLDTLENVQRVRVVKELTEARAQGDLSENFDYDAAKTQQGKIESEISRIRAILDNFEIINHSKTKDVVCIGSKIKILDISSKKEHTYEILGSLDNDPKNGKISNESPFAVSIMGKSVGDEIEIKGISTSYKVKILAIL